MCSKHVEAWNKLIVKQILCIKLVNYWDKYTEMHGQQNIKNVSCVQFECLFILKAAVFWDTMPYSLVMIVSVFEERCLLSFQVGQVERVE